jgi:hypothetical protein
MCYIVVMDDGTGKTIEGKAQELEILRIEAAERKKRRHRFIGIRYEKTVSDNKKRARKGFFS